MYQQKSVFDRQIIQIGTYNCIETISFWQWIVEGNVLAKEL